MKTWVKTLNILALPIVLISNFGFIVSGIWLLILDEWKIIITGLLWLISAHLLLGWIFMIGMIFVIPSAYFFDKNNQLGGIIFGSLNVLFTIAVVVVWCVFVLLYFLKYANNDSFYPILIWSYSVAISPLSFLSYKDLQGGNEMSMISTFFAKLGFISMILGILLFDMNISLIWIVFSSVMFIGLIVQLTIAYKQ